MNSLKRKSKKFKIYRNQSNTSLAIIVSNIKEPLRIEINEQEMYA